jgi:transcriptional regulator with XRE-family HTH domain
MAKTISERLQEARKLPAYWVERAVLQITGKLWDAMTQKNLTQAALAQKVDKKPTYVNRVLNGNHNVTLKTLVTLAHALDMEVKIDLVEKSNFVASIATNSVINKAAYNASVRGRFHLVSSQELFSAANENYLTLAA